MTLDQIKSAVSSGVPVYWKQSNYQVMVDNFGQWYIVCSNNNHCVGLTWQDGATLNGNPEDFYTAY